ncbi:hypothetical protein CROQUDRAFT_110860 [Cronartium quercuum f. sp. fusiforme G11]|uniref:Uncharacterized protein n=1 Tax=Cronartium quercuum f. sp. fusiforme G11 TaxID=708437 RepID=A0A9P6NAR9_9BASI|nr:hypothetical protein CROQUDRAFT_110860 [Cronartium quercuum f. sp. fusiforme G11]
MMIDKNQVNHSGNNVASSEVLRRPVVGSKETQVHELDIKIKKQSSKNSGNLGDKMIMPNPFNSGCMFKGQHIGGHVINTTKQ